MNALSTLVFVLFSAISAAAAGVHFPPSASSQSPDGKWKIACEPSQITGQTRLLVLKDAVGKRVELRHFDRDCAALWSKDSARIAVTDWLTSDRSDVFIYSVAHPRAGKSVSKLFPRTAIPKEERDGHCYFEAMEWLDAGRLRIKVSGHRDVAPASNFAHEFVFDVRSGRFEKPQKSGVEQGAANRSQPIGAEANPTPPADGSAG